MPFAPSSFLAPSSKGQEPLVASLLLVAMPFAPSSDALCSVRSVQDHSWIFELQGGALILRTVIPTQRSSGGNQKLYRTVGARRWMLRELERELKEMVP